MKLTAIHVADYAKLAIGSRPGGMSLFELINIAGTHLAGMHAWQFFQGRSFLLNLRGDVSITSASWTQASKTITRFGAFAGYDFLLGDTFEVTAGTGLAPGVYPVVSKVDDNNITIDTDVGPDAVDLEGTLEIAEPELVAVPSYVEEILGIDAVSGSFTGQVGYVTKQELASLKAQAWDATPLGKIYATDVWVGNPLERWLEIYPVPLVAAADHLRAWGRSTWEDLAADSDQINLPRYVQPLFLEVVRAFTRAYMQPETNPLDEELRRLEEGGVFAAALRADSTFLPSLGRLGPGAASRGAGGIDLITSPIGGPVSP